MSETTTNNLIRDHLGRTWTPEQVQEMATKLRAAFPDSAIGKLPRTTKSGKTIYLDYVGHAATTDRLLQVDPLWFWEPLAYGDDGLPAFDKNGGLWIRLYVGPFVIPGYGDAQGKSGPNAVKEAIGDAIRNAAMRLGVALDLWAKEDLTGEDETPRPQRKANTKPPKKEKEAKASAELTELLDAGLPEVEEGPLALAEFLAELERHMVAAGYWPEGVINASLEARGYDLDELASDVDAMRGFVESALEKAKKRVGER